MSVIQVPSQARLELPIEKIAALCERYGVAELHLFGSILRDDFRDDSDVDFMVRFLESQAALFGDFRGIEFEDLVDFYQHQQNWSNRMILGDSLLVMTSLAEKEGLKGRYARRLGRSDRSPA